MMVSTFQSQSKAVTLLRMVNIIQDDAQDMGMQWSVAHRNYLLATTHR